MTAVTLHVEPAGVNALYAAGGGVDKFVRTVAGGIAEAGAGNVGHDTGQLSEAIGYEITHTPGKIAARVGVLVERDSRKGGGSNALILEIEEFGDGREAATHPMSDALSAARK